MFRLADARVRLCEPGDHDAWQEYVQRADLVSCYHQIGWKRVIERSFGVETFYLLSEDERKRITGILPLAFLSSLAFGRFLVSLPYFNYGGICADDGAAGPLFDAAVELARTLRAKHVELRHTTPQPGLLESTTKVSMRLALPSSSDELWRGFSSDLRRKVRRPQKEGITARIEHADALDAFYQVFRVNMRDLGTPVYGKSFFANILAEFPESTWVCTVYQDSRPLASGILVGFRDRLEIPWVSSLRATNHLYTNMLLYWTALKFACDRGYRVFDFGRSTAGGGTYRFKAQWGAQPVQLYWHYWVKNGSLPRLNPENPKYALAIGLWQRLPLTVTNFLGPSIVRHLP
jgi:FemAB-related protein (PEP-CTERM system-associated)